MAKTEDINLNQAAKSRAEVANETLEKAKGNFDEVLVVGVKNGDIDLVPSIATYQFTQWVLSRAAFKLNVSEDNALAARSTEETT